MSKIRSVYTPSWMDLLGLHPLHRTGLRILDWWSDMSGGSIPDRRGTAALTLLISLEIWSEHSARVFHNKQTISHIVFDRNKKKTQLGVAGFQTFERNDVGRVIFVIYNFTVL
jgi:hypothetical protein